MNHFGDIMSTGDVTSNEITGDFTGLERIVLTANGNLQRILSAYFNAKVGVVIVKNKELPEGPEEAWLAKQGGKIAKTVVQSPASLYFDRHVELVCSDRVMCDAKSLVEIYDTSIQELVSCGKVGIGQLYLNILPSFTLVDFGRNPHTQSIWREYQLETKGIVCKIVEVFPSDLFA
ncbi:hypothetical protein HDU91_007329 [Kappamyces sp. JEL0680]|nr:hypothetical protein HDU91_007329 [Kappamyces sp. JEL0680]